MTVKGVQAVFSFKLQLVVYAVFMMSNYILPSYEEFLHRDDLTLVRLKRLLKFDCSWVNQVNYHEESPLFILLKNKKSTSDMVLLFLEYNSNINYQNMKGDTCLFIALRFKKDESVINILLKNGANVNIRNEEQQTLLCHYFYWGTEHSKNIIKLLLDAKCPINDCGLHGSLMHCFLDAIALDLNPFELIKDILELLNSVGVGMNSVDTNGNSPLCLALQYGLGARIIKLLMSKGGSLNACERHDSPMLCATDSTWMPRLTTDVVYLLLKKKAVLDKRSSGGTPLKCALMYTYYEMQAIKLMVNHSSFDVNALFEDYGNFLNVAVLNPYCKLSVLELLIDKGVRIDEKNKYGQTLIELAFKAGRDCHVLKLLFVACSSIQLIHISLLYFAMDEYKSESCQKNLDRLKLLLKCFLLENRDLQVQDWRLNHNKHSQFLRFVDQCWEELQRMELQNFVRNHTLRDFPREPCFPHNCGSNCSSRMISYDLNKLLRILSYNNFPIYFDIIIAKIGRISLEAKLEEVPVYTIQNYTASSCRERCIELDNDSLRQITQYLLDEDLVQLIIAFLFFSD